VQISRQTVYLLQFVVGAFFVIALWFTFFRDRSESRFKLREADRIRPKGPTKPPQKVGTSAKKTPLLSGIKITGAPHEILGVAKDATPAEVQKAYKELMKQYHPDTVGRPGTREWSDAQKIAQALNNAKTALLKK
jgi:DnaJ-domain-containing protein 1